MRRGLDLILSRIREQPSPILAHRYLALVAELPDEKEKFDRTLDLAQHLLDSRPKEALRLALVAHRAYRQEIRPLDIMIVVLEQRGKTERARLLRAEREKIRKDLEKTLQNRKGVPKSPRPEDSFADKRSLEVTFSSTRIPQTGGDSKISFEELQSESGLLEAAVMDLWENDEGSATQHSQVIPPVPKKKPRVPLEDNPSMTQQVGSDGLPFSLEPTPSPPSPPRAPQQKPIPPGSPGPKGEGKGGVSEKKNNKISPQPSSGKASSVAQNRVYPAARSAREHKPPKRTILSPKLVQGLEGKRPGDTILGIRVNSKPPMSRPSSPQSPMSPRERENRPGDRVQKNPDSVSLPISSREIPSGQRVDFESPAAEALSDRKTVPPLQYQRPKGVSESLANMGSRPLEFADDDPISDVFREKSQEAPAVARHQGDPESVDAQKPQPQSRDEAPLEATAVAIKVPSSDQQPAWNDGERTVVAQMPLEYRYARTQWKNPQADIALRKASLPEPLPLEDTSEDQEPAYARAHPIAPPDLRAPLSRGPKASFREEEAPDEPIPEEFAGGFFSENGNVVSQKALEPLPQIPPPPFHPPLQTTDETRVYIPQAALDQGDQPARRQETLNPPGIGSVSDALEGSIVEALAQDQKAIHAPTRSGASSDVFVHRDVEEPTLIIAVPSETKDPENPMLEGSSGFLNEKPRESQEAPWIFTATDPSPELWKEESLVPPFVPSMGTSPPVVDCVVGEERVQDFSSEDSPITPFSGMGETIKLQDPPKWEEAHGKGTRFSEELTLPPKLLQGIIAEIKISDASRKQDLIWSLMQGLWGDELCEDTIYVLEQCSLTHLSLAFWDFYLRALLATGDYRRALQEIRFTLRIHNKLPWAMLAYGHLQEIWTGLGVKGFSWEPEWGLQSLMDSLNRAPRPSLVSLVTCEGYEIVEDPTPEGAL